MFLSLVVLLSLLLVSLSLLFSSDTRSSLLGFFLAALASEELELQLIEVEIEANVWFVFASFKFLLFVALTPSTRICSCSVSSFWLEEQTVSASNSSSLSTTWQSISFSFSFSFVCFSSFFTWMLLFVSTCWTTLLLLSTLFPLVCQMMKKKTKKTMRITHYP